MQPASANQASRHSCQTRRHCGWRDGRLITAAVLSKCLGKQVDIQLIESEEIGTVGGGASHHPAVDVPARCAGDRNLNSFAPPRPPSSAGHQLRKLAQRQQALLPPFGKTGKSHWSGLPALEARKATCGLASDYGDYCPNCGPASDNRFATECERTRLQLRLPLRHTLYAPPAQISGGTSASSASKARDRQVHTDPTHAGFITGLERWKLPSWWATSSSIGTGIRSPAQ